MQDVGGKAESAGDDPTAVLLGEGDGEGKGGDREGGRGEGGGDDTAVLISRVELGEGGEGGEGRGGDGGGGEVSVLELEGECNETDTSVVVSRLEEGGEEGCVAKDVLVHQGEGEGVGMEE